MFEIEGKKVIFIVIIILLGIGMILPFFTKLWN